MPKRIILDPDYIRRIRQKVQNPPPDLVGAARSKITCRFCGFRLMDKYPDMSGHFETLCPKCGQIAVYNAAEYRHFRYFPHS